jgi:hypothetical protein
VHLARSERECPTREWNWDSYRITPDTDWDVIYLRRSVLKFRFAGFGWLRGAPYVSAKPFGNTKAFPLVPWLNLPPYNAVIVPYWFIAMALAGAVVVAGNESGAGAT